MTRDHASSSRRPMLLRNDTETLLDYYQSPLADQGDKQLHIQQQQQPVDLISSSPSSSSSDYSSSDSEYSTNSPNTLSPASRRVRPKSTTDGGDRRRTAIVPTTGMDVALVVPPDSASKHQRSQSHAVDEDKDKRPPLGPKRRSTGQSVHSVVTPDIGDRKSMEIPVAAPVVVGTFRALDASSYLHYQPGLHSTAGPLPPPPMLDPQKREQIEAVRQALQLPPSVEAALARRTPSPSIHRREGAFSPSLDRASIPEVDSIPSSPVPVIIAPLVIQPPPRNASLHEHPKRRKRVSAELSISDPDVDEPIIPPTPSPPPKSLRNSLTRGFRRLSRSPSTSSRTPSPPPARQLSPPQPTGPLAPPKIKALYPSAMYCPELHPPAHASKMTSLERCNIYIQKINELYVYDCGLGDWLMEARIRTRSSSTHDGGGGPNIPSTMIFTPQPRNTSHGSEASEVTFPTRPDAGVATDLSSPSSSTVSAILPYPALPPRTSSMPKSGGFFSSLGRKTSTSRRAPAASTTPVPTSHSQPHSRTVLTKRPTITPSVPGGPRPPGGWKRISRSQTVTIPRSSESDAFSSDGHGRVTSPEPHDPTFEVQLDKLAVLLPQADRNILAGYLRRAGTDLVAIGLYLDDEKNNRLRRD